MSHASLLPTSGAALNVAVIGAGYMAEEHLRVFSDIADVQLAGIFSRSRAKAKALAKKHRVARVCGSIAELHAETQAHLVIIAVSELSAGEVCAEAFQYPWTCLIEKPAGYDVADAERIAAQARRIGRKAYVALNRRHYSSTQRVVDDLAGVPGQRLVHVHDQEDPAAAQLAGRPELVVRNWMFANSIHVVDYLRVLGRGDVVSVEPFIRWNPAEPRFVAAKVAFSSGDVGIYEAIWNGPGPWAVTVTTQERRWELRPLERAAVQVHGSRKLEPADVHEWDVKFKPGLRAQAQEAIHAVQGRPHRLPDLEDALASMRLVEQIYVSTHAR